MTHTHPHAREHTHALTCKHLQGHAKLFQPLLLQFFGLEEELKATLTLVMCEVESVGPLRTRRRRRERERESEREREREEEGHVMY